MKKSSIFKILTLFLTFIIFSCCSGCIFAIADYFNEKDLQKALEIQKEKKALADALVPEIEGYTFEAKPDTHFTWKEGRWESQGFKTFEDFFRGGGLFDCLEKYDSEKVKEYCNTPARKSVWKALKDSSGFTGKLEDMPLNLIKELFTKLTEE